MRMKKLIIDFVIRTDGNEKIATSYDLSQEYRSGVLTERVFDRIFRSGRLSIFRYLRDEMDAIIS